MNNDQHPSNEKVDFQGLFGTPPSSTPEPVEESPTPAVPERVEETPPVDPQDTRDPLVPVPDPAPITTPPPVAEPVVPAPEPTVQPDPVVEETPVFEAPTAPSPSSASSLDAARQTSANISSIIEKLKKQQEASSQPVEPSVQESSTPAIPAPQPVAPIAPVQVPAAPQPGFDPLAEPSPDTGLQEIAREVQSGGPLEPLNPQPGFDPLVPPTPSAPQADLPEVADPKQSKSPSVAPVENYDDYRPAYAEEEQEAFAQPVAPAQSVPAPTPAVQPPAPQNQNLPAVPAAPSPPPEAFAADFLYSIGTVDPSGGVAAKDVALVTSIREGAIESEGRKRRTQKMKLKNLPFDSIIPGTPLIATIFSPSGGVGKSSLSMNLGVYIAAVGDAMAKKRAQQSGDQKIRSPRVLVLDGDVVQGSLAIRLNNSTTPSIHDLVLYMDDREDEGFTGEDRWPSTYENAPVNEQSMRDFTMWPDKLPNLNLLAAPPEPDLFFDLTQDDFQEILRLLGRFYDVIIIDAGTEVVMRSNRTWLSSAHEVFLVTAPEIDRVFNARKVARYMTNPRPNLNADSPNQPAELPPITTQDKLSLIMNKADLQVGFNVESNIAEAFPWLNSGNKFMVPDLGTEMIKANNTGRFVVLENAEFATSIGEIAGRLFSRYAIEKNRAYSS